MKSIKNNIQNELIIKNSKFITNLYRINEENDIIYYLNHIKTIYKDATHHCYAYIFNDKKKADDDKEPSKTAGIPILNVLEKNNLNNVLAIVTRYYGGIKLGASGLVRAYSNSIICALAKTQIIELIKGKNIDIIFNYNNIKNIDYILKDLTILNKDFKDYVIYNLNVSDDFLEELKKIDYIKIIVNNDTYME